MAREEVAGISLEDLREARRRIAGRLHVTPVFGSESLGRQLGVRLAVKAELFQKTGSFKPRGALHKLSRLTAAEKQRGLVTTSAGNHAAGLAFAAATEGVACTVVMPENANPTKVRATQAYGAEVVLHGDVGDAFRRAHELEAERGLTFVHPFDDRHVIAGAGSLGLELVEQVPGLDAVVVPIGGADEARREKVGEEGGTDLVGLLRVLARRAGGQDRDPLGA